MRGWGRRRKGKGEEGEKDGGEGVGKEEMEEGKEEGGGGEGGGRGGKGGRGEDLLFLKVSGDRKVCGKQTHSHRRSSTHPNFKQREKSQREVTLLSHNSEGSKSSGCRHERHR